MDNLDFLDGSEEPKGEAVTPEVVTEAPAEPEVTEMVEETTEQRASRDERGRFKAKEAEEPVMVPLKALHETRDEVKALKAELDRLRPAQQQEQPQVPDMFEDPEGYQAYQNANIQGALINTTLNISEEMTRASVGSEVVEAAQQWGAQAFASNPSLYQHFLSQRNPYGFLVEQYQQAQAYSQLGDPNEIKAYLAWKQAQQAAPAGQPAPTQSQRPSSSIASATSAGGAQHQAVGPGVAFDEHFRN